MSNAAIATNIYGKYSVPEGLDHRPAVRLVKSGKVYEPRTIAFMMRHAGKGDIIHAGTFFGDFLPALSSAMGEGRKVWAFEPNPDSHENAARTIDLNDLKNVTLRRAAVSADTGTVHFRTHDDKGKPLGGHSHFVPLGGAPGIEAVESIRLDDAVPVHRPVSILQLDVEGHEISALSGARDLIHRWRPILILEGFRRPRWIRRTFRGLGYQLRGEMHHNKVFSVDPVEF
ncbi:MAG: FkbM family methyltransferase [Pseudooceanicola sp.]